jgi:hypothetical protein
MINDNEIINVTNRNNGTTGYIIPDLGNLHRNFSAGETKKITMEELRKLSYIPGGETILREYLVIDNKEALEELLNGVEPEYFYTEEEVKALLLTGSLDQLMDCLDFAPEGVIDLVKNYAVELKINDIQKRQVILDKTGFNVTSAITVNEETNEEDEKVVTGRRAAPVTVTEPAAPARRSAPVPSKYKVVSK